MQVSNEKIINEISFILALKEYYLTIISGIDLQGMMEIGQSLAQHEDIARKCKIMESKIKDYQDAFTAIEKVLLFV